MPSQKSRFGPWLPDIPVLGSPGSDVVENALPVQGGFRPLRRVAPVTEALNKTILAAVYALSSNRTAFGFVATSSTLEAVDDTSFKNISRAGGYQTPDGGDWDFARFRDLLFASNFGDPIQQFDLNTDTKFANIEAGAPKCRFLAVVNRFLCAFNLNVDGTLLPTGVRWSGVDTPSKFPPIDILTGIRSDEAIQTLSDRQILGTEFGEITGVRSGPSGADAVVFQEESITAMNFQQGEFIFSFDVLEGARGCIAPRSIVQEGGRVFYLADTGLHVTDGVSSDQIGDSRVDDFIFAAVVQDRIREIRGEIDVRGKFIYWFLPGFDDLALIYNYSINEFSLGRGLGLRAFVRALSTAPSFESAVEPFGSTDNMPLSLDDPQFSGSTLPSLAAIDEQNRLGPLSGATLSARLRTPEIEPVEDGRAYTQFARPLIDTDQVTVRAITRDEQQRPQVVGAGARLSGGKASIRQTARYWALEIETDEGAEWTFAQGIQAVFEAAGNEAPDAVEVDFIRPKYLLAVQHVRLTTDEGVPLLWVDQVEPAAEPQGLVTGDGKQLVTDDGKALVALLTG